MDPISTHSEVFRFVNLRPVQQIYQDKIPGRFVTFNFFDLISPATLAGIEASENLLFTDLKAIIVGGGAADPEDLRTDLENAVTAFRSTSPNYIEDLEALDAFFPNLKEVLDYLILKDFKDTPALFRASVESDLIPSTINAGIYYNELAWNPNLIIFLIKYQLELSSNEGIEVYKDYERLKDITLDFIKQSRIPEHKFKPYSKNNKSLARWNDGTKLIFLNPRYDRDLEYEKDHFNKVIAHELFHFLSKIHHKDEYDYPDYTMLATPMTVRASETDMLNMIISNWDSPLFILHD